MRNQKGSRQNTRNQDAKKGSSRDPIQGRRGQTPNRADVDQPKAK